jgi:hypothetical protein
MYDIVALALRVLGFDAFVTVVSEPVVILSI